MIFPFHEKEKKTLTPEDQDRLWEGYRHEIETNCSQDDLVIFSAERFARFHENEAERVKKLMETIFDDITIVIYLRRQTEHILSLYKEDIRNGMPWAFLEYIPLAYDEIIKCWSVFGKEKIKVRLFDKKEFHDNDLLSDFAHTAGFEMTGLERVENQNETILDSAEMEFLRLFNSHIPPLLDPWTHNPYFWQVRSLLESYQRSSEEKQKAYNMNREEARRILQQCREGNDWVAREYLDREKLFSEDVSMYPEEVESPHGLTLERCAEISAHLWKERCDTIRKLQQENQKIITENDACNAEIQRQQAEIQYRNIELQRYHYNFSLFQQKSLIYWDYYRCKVLAKITFGKKRKHYKEKRNTLHEQIRQIRDLCKDK